MHAVPASHLARTLPHRDRKWAGGAQPIRYAGFVRSRSPVVRPARTTGDMRPTGRAQHSRVTEARAEAAERPGVEPASAGQVDVGRQAGRPGRAPPVLAPEGTERRRKSSGAAGDRRDRLRRERWSAPETPTAGRRGVRPGRRLARRDLRCRCCPDRGLSEDSVERQVEERPAGAERRRGQVHRRPTCGSISPTSITVPAYLVTGARIGGWSKLLQAARAPSETAVPGRRGRRRASR
jgi:hypothetical protein